MPLLEASRQGGEIRAESWFGLAARTERESAHMESATGLAMQACDAGSRVATGETCSRASTSWKKKLYCKGAAYTVKRYPGRGRERNS